MQQSTTPLARPLPSDTDLTPLKQSIMALSFNDLVHLIEWMKREHILGFRAEAMAAESISLDSRTVS